MKHLMSINKSFSSESKKKPQNTPPSLNPTKPPPPIPKPKTKHTHHEKKRYQYHQQKLKKPHLFIPPKTPHNFPQHLPQPYNFPNLNHISLPNHLNHTTPAPTHHLNHITLPNTPTSTIHLPNPPPQP